MTILVVGILREDGGNQHVEGFRERHAPVRDAEVLFQQSGDAGGLSPQRRQRESPEFRIS